MVLKRYNVLKCTWDDAQSRNNEHLETLDDEDLEADTWIDALCSTYDQMEVKTDKYLKSVKMNEKVAEEHARQQAILQENDEQCCFLRSVREMETKKFDLAFSDLSNSITDVDSSHPLNSTQVNVFKAKLAKQATLLSSCEDANKKLIAVMKSQEEKNTELSWELDLHSKFTKLENEVNHILFDSAEEGSNHSISEDEKEIFL